MTQKSRLKHLEEAFRHRQTKREYDYTDEEWLGVFEQWDAEGMFQNESDFPAALDNYRQGLAEVMKDPGARHHVTKRRVELFLIAIRQRPADGSSSK
jgi:hypothetical protein